MASSVQTTWLGPLVSFRTALSNPGPVHVYGDSDSTLEWAGTVNFTGSVTIGDILDTAGITISTISVDFGSVPGNDSSTTTAGINGLTANSIVLAVQPASIWSGAYYDLNVSAKPSAASVLELVASNSAATAVDPAAMNFRVVWLSV